MPKIQTKLPFIKTKRVVSNLNAVQMPKIQTKVPVIKPKKVLSRKEKRKAYLKAYNKKWHQKNKEKRNLDSKKYREKNREKVKEYNKKYREKHREKMNLFYKKYYSKHKDKRKETKRKYRKKRNENRRKRYNTDKNYRLRCILRSRLKNALKAQKGTKNLSALKLVGLNLDKLKKWIESQFQKGMTWENIHIDHMMPCASFDLTDEKNHAICFHYTNLKPEFAKDNISFGAKIKHDMKWMGDQWYIKSDNGLYKPRAMSDILFSSVGRGV